MALRSETTDEIKRLIMEHNTIMIRKMALYFLTLSNDEQLEFTKKIDEFGSNGEPTESN